jgi:glutathione S-transferase
MKLYFTPGACSLAPHIVMHELGMAFETEKVNLREKTTAAGNFLTVNPKGQIPTLKLDSNEFMTEGVAIMQYLADQKPEMNLVPKWGSIERYRAIEWLNFTSTEIHKAYTPLFFADRYVTEETARAGFVANCKASLLKKIEWVEAQLNGKDYLMGKDFTICDAYMFTCLSWSTHVAVDLSPFKNITAWNSRVYARKGVQAAMKAEGLLK